MSVVIIPAYRPDETFITLTDQLWTYGCQIVVVDDGSGKEYEALFERVEDICIVLHHTENRGKGAAIKTALAYIRKELWGQEVIGIMDADGQHLPEDMVRLLTCAENHEDSLVLGVRKVGRSMPLRSRIGNTLTREIFQRISGVKVSDTQTGLRAFGSGLLEKLSAVSGERYEYEMNVLLEVARSGIPIKEIPIRTIYRDEKNSTSHFRVLQDSVRIYRDLLKFTLVSLSSFVLDYLLFLLLTVFFPKEAGWILAANVMARCISAFYNYSLNCRFVFHTARKVQTAAEYFTLAVLILLLNNVILGAFLHLLFLPVYLAKLLTECTLFIISWLVQHNLIFGKKKMQPAKLDGEVDA